MWKRRYFIDAHLRKEILDADRPDFCGACGGPCEHVYKLNWPWGGLISVFLDDCKGVPGAAGLAEYERNLMELEHAGTLFELFRILENFTEKDRNYLNSPLLDPLPSPEF